MRERLAAVLSEDELQRAEGFYLDRDRHRFIVGRGILRTILARYLNKEAREIKFCYGCRGKPALANSNKQLYFNVSHSGGIALYAIAHKREVGIDIEQIREMPDAVAIATQFFSERENAALYALPAEQRLQAFFHAWTRKEAYLKAKGDGLAQPLNSVEVSLAPGEPAQLLRIDGSPAAASRWALADINPAPGFAAALATEAGNFSLAYWQWQS
ncbi:MAG TPA: 4'-phosphopantetheinyl transferase superfamily protein [Oscillatoriaceae cyanobacterium M7585_C2015_266]|nr:4'-phosphopantetheinyl transferase superfamily protein [Oscillatoriaceae cyanobacterium M7585_C2015_266]